MAKEANCYMCNDKFGLFRWRHFCEECGKTFCSTCIARFDSYCWYISKKPTDKYEKKYLCKTCWEKKISTFHSKYIISVENADSVDTFPKTYKGRIPLKSKSNCINIESDIFRNRDATIKQLQVTALIEEYDIIFDIEYIKRTASEPGSGKGTHYFSVWKAVGKAGIKLK